jgi:dynein heavy chain, axonemal
MFPGLVNCTTIDWFTQWPSDALFEVATKVMEPIEVGSERTKEAICQVFVTVHESVTAKSERMFDEIKRRNYVTPTNYLEFLNGYKLLLIEKTGSLLSKAQKLRSGLTKLGETAQQVEEMQVGHQFQQHMAML